MVKHGEMTIARSILIVCLAAAAWIASPAGGAGEGTGVPAAELPLKAVVEAGILIDAVGNPAVRAYLQKRLDALLAGDPGAERNAALESFLAELRAAVPAGGAMPVPGNGAASNHPPDQAAALAGAARNVELVNLLTQYASILQDLEGGGSETVRRELVDNLNTSGINADAMGLLRQLVLVCDEAERTLRNRGYIEEDVAKAEKSLYLENLGTYGATSLLSGNPLPLLKAAAAIAKGRYTLSKEKDRQVGIEIQNHRGRLANFLFEVGVRRANLKSSGADDGAFVTQEGYNALQDALAEPDAGKRLAALSRCVAACPALREAVFCLAVATHEAGEPAEAERRFREVAVRESQLLVHDGLRAAAYDRLAGYALGRGEHSNTVALARRALECDPRTAGALNHLALAMLGLGDVPAACGHAAGALQLDPMNGRYLWTASRVAAARRKPDLALTFLRAALNNGFHDSAEVYACAALREALATPRGQRVVQPPLAVSCDPQLLNHRFAVSNMAGYAITGLVVQLTVRYEANGAPAREQTFSRRVAALPAGGVIGFAMAGAPKDGFRCRMQADYQCAGHPGRVFRAVSCFNMEGTGEHLSWSDYLHRSALRALQEGDAARREQGLRLAGEAAEWTAFEDAEILGTCAKLAAALGREAEVDRYSDAARRAGTLRPLQNSVLVGAAAKRLCETDEPAGK